MYTASLRAPEGFSLPLAMTQSQSAYSGNKLFDKFGGHPCAAGFTIADSKNLPIAKTLMLQELENQGKNMINTAMVYNGEISVPSQMSGLVFRKEIIWTNESDIDKDFLAQILNMDPFGQDFPLPNLAFEVSTWSVRNRRWLGQDQKHIKLTTKNNTTITIFNLTEDFVDFFIQSQTSTEPTEKLWVIAKPVQNCWNNIRNIELIADKVFLI